MCHQVVCGHMQLYLLKFNYLTLLKQSFCWDLNFSNDLVYTIWIVFWEVCFCLFYIWLPQSGKTRLMLLQPAPIDSFVLCQPIKTWSTLGVRVWQRAAQYSAVYREQITAMYSAVQCNVLLYTGQSSAVQQCAVQSYEKEYSAVTCSEIQYSRRLQYNMDWFYPRTSNTVLNPTRVNFFIFYSFFWKQFEDVM